MNTCKDTCKNDVTQKIKTRISLLENCGVCYFEERDQNIEHQTRKISLAKNDYETIISTPGSYCHTLSKKLCKENHIYYHSVSGNKYMLWWSDISDDYTRIYNDVGEISVVDVEWILHQNNK
jgi:hypothetical protein